MNLASRRTSTRPPPLLRRCAQPNSTVWGHVSTRSEHRRAFCQHIVRGSSQDAGKDANGGAGLGEGQEQLATVASALVTASKNVFLQKLASYTAQLKEVEAAGDKNPVWRLVNGWTARLLQRKIETCLERLSAIVAIESSVMSCSLDGECTFKVRLASSDSKKVGVPDLVKNADVRRMLSASAEALRMLSALQMELVVDKQASLKIPPLVGEDASEVEDLQAALKASFSEASGVPGVRLELRKRYDLVENCSEQDVSDVLKSQLGEELFKDMAELGIAFKPDSVLPLALFVSAVINATASTLLAGLVGWLLRCDRTITTLDWSHLIPRSFSEAETIVLWTLPFASVYAILAILREQRVLDKTLHQSGPLTAIANALQTSSRSLIVFKESTADDVRVLYAISTAAAVCAIAPWVYVLLPTLVTNLGLLLQPNTVSLDPYQGRGLLVTLLTFPTVALASAVVVGAISFNQDLFQNDDKGKDGLPTLEDLFKVSFADMQETAVDQKEAESIVRTQLQSSGCDPAIIEQKVQELAVKPPNVITLDFASANRQVELQQQAQWVVPTAVTFTTFYLMLEALLTGQATSAVITELVAILTMDAITKPWRHCSMEVVVELERNGVPLSQKSTQDVESKL